MRLRDMNLSDLDKLTATLAVPSGAWRGAGLEVDPSVVTLADCTFDQLHAFALLSPKTLRGRLLQISAQCLVVDLTNDEQIIAAVRSHSATLWADVPVPSVLDSTARTTVDPPKTGSLTIRGQQLGWNGTT